MENAIQFPFEIKDAEQSDELKKYFTGTSLNYVRVGPKGYLHRQQYREQSYHIYNMPLRADDIFISCIPRSGSTLMRELVWLVNTDMNFDDALAIPLRQRVVSFESSALTKEGLNSKKLSVNSEDPENQRLFEVMATPGYERLAATPSPRYIHTHLPLSLLPPSLLDTSRVIYMARDPRDVAVSYYHFARLFKYSGFVGDFKTFWNLFVNDRITFTPYFEHVKEAWRRRHHQNLLFLFYEDVSKDLPSTIRRVAAFLDKDLSKHSEEQLARLVQHLSIDSFRTNKSVNQDHKQMNVLVDGEQPFIRKGESGGWRDHSYFTEEMQEQAERWIRDNLRDTDLRFPSMTPDIGL